MINSALWRILEKLGFIRQNKTSLIYFLGVLIEDY